MPDHILYVNKWHRRLSQTVVLHQTMTFRWKQLPILRFLSEQILFSFAHITTDWKVKTRWNVNIIDVTLQAGVCLTWWKKTIKRTSRAKIKENWNERANLIRGGRFSERNIGDWGRSRRNSGGGGTVHHGNFYSGESDERQRTRMWVGRRGNRNDMVTMAKCVGSKVMAQVKWYCQDEFEQESRHMQTK